MKRLIVSLMAFGMLATACGGGGEKINPEATIRLGWPDVPSTLDPHKPPNPGSIAFTLFFYDTLVMVDAKRQVQPGLATKWTISQDGKTYTFTLREGVKFGDNTPFDANAVKASLERAKAEPLMAPKLTNLVSVQVRRPDMVVLELAKPDSTFLFTMSEWAGMIISPTAISSGTPLDDKPAGTTPYRVVEYKPGTKLIVERRSDAKYWDPDAWTVKRFEITAMTDNAVIMNAFRTDKIDLAKPSLPEDQIRSQIAGKDAEVFPSVSSAVRVLLLRTSRAKFGDLSVRQAIGKAINTQKIVDAVLKPCTYAPQLFTRDAPGYIDDYNPYEHDPTSAKQAIEAAGGGFGFETVILTTPAEKAFAETAAQDLKNVGLNMKITPSQPAEAYGGFRAGKFDAAVLSLGGALDPTIIAETSLVATFQLFEADALARIKELIGRANSLPLGSSDRAVALKELNRFISDLAVAIPICHITQNWLIPSHIGGVKEMSQQYAAVFDARTWSVLE